MIPPPKEMRRKIGKAERDGRHSLGPKAPNPEGVGELVNGLEDVGKDDGAGKAEQSTCDGPLKNALGWASGR